MRKVTFLLRRVELIQSKTGLSETGNATLDTDISQEGIGAVPSQVQKKEEMVLSYINTSLGRTERNYCVTRKELPAFVMSVEHYPSFVYERKFYMNHPLNGNTKVD